MSASQEPTGYTCTCISYVSYLTLFVLIATQKICNIIFSAIAIAHDSSFKKDQEILVLPLDTLKFDTHEKLTQNVLKHFGKVWYCFLLSQSF